MHPVLFEIPLPAWALPLGWTLGLLAAAGLVLALLAWRRGALDLLVIGAVLALCGVVGGVLFRGQRFVLAPLPVYSYGAMLCASLVAGWFLTLRLGQRAGLGRELLANCYFTTAIAALIGARLLYVLTNPSEFHDLLDALALRSGGLVAYGGFLGGFVGSWWYLRRRGVALLPWADVAVPSLACGLMLTRIGCYLFGCDFGKPLSASAPAWLKRLGTFPRWPSSVLEGQGSPAWLQHVDERGLSVTSRASLPVHPTELYESLAGAALLLFLFWLSKRRRFTGELFFAFTFGYGYLRFLLEIVRDDSERGSFGPSLSDRVLIPVCLLIFAGALGYGLKRWVLTALGGALAFGVFWLLHRHPVLVALSTSQWVSLLTALGVAYAWRRQLLQLRPLSST